MTIAARKIRLIMQLRRAGIADTAVLSAIERIPREAFVPESFQDQSYEDMTLPIGRGQTLSAPSVVALMTQALGTDRRTKVLEIGTGTGYQAAVLSRLCRRLYTVERHRELLGEAERRFLKLRLYNITTRVGDGARGWPEQVQGVRPCRQGRRDEGTTIDEGVDPAGRPYLWIGNFLSDDSSDRGTDLAAIAEGAIGVTPLHMDMTHKATLKKLAGIFE